MDLKDVLEVAAQVRSTIDPRPRWLKDLQEVPSSEGLYYRFLHQLCARARPKGIVETGTRYGFSAIQMAAGCPEAKIVTLDIDPGSKARVEDLCREHGFRNVVAITADSQHALGQVLEHLKEAQVVYLDSDHRYDLLKKEFEIYSNLVPSGGVVLMDDVKLTPDLRKFWDEVPQPKADLDFLHHLYRAGFGAYVKP